MELTHDHAKPIIARISQIAGHSPPVRLVAGLATLLPVDADYKLAAWKSQREEFECWDLLAATDRALVFVEAENPTEDWTGGFDPGAGSFVRGRVIRLADVLTVEFMSVDSLDIGAVVEWENGSWRIVLRDGQAFEPESADNRIGIDAVRGLALSIRDHILQ